MNPGRISPKELEDNPQFKFIRERAVDSYPIGVVEHVVKCLTDNTYWACEYRMYTDYSDWDQQATWIEVEPVQVIDYKRKK